MQFSFSFFDNDRINEDICALKSYDVILWREKDMLVFENEVKEVLARGHVVVILDDVVLLLFTFHRYVSLNLLCYPFIKFNTLRLSLLHFKTSRQSKRKPIIKTCNNIHLIPAKLINLAHRSILVHIRLQSFNIFCLNWVSQFDKFLYLFVTLFFDGFIHREFIV